MAKIVFFGTPEIAVTPLRRLIGDHHDVVLVVTGADKRRGRGSLKSPSPVKEAAGEIGIEVTSSIEDVRNTSADLGVVVAFGRLIPADLLNSVPMLNLHFSALPRWRGAAPLERAILAGDKTTAVCVMEVAEQLDAGGIYASREVTIGDDEYLSDLRNRMVEIGSSLLSEVLREGTAGLLEPRPQVGEVTYAHKLTREELEIRWDRSTDEVMRTVCLEQAWTRFRSKRLKVLGARRLDEPIDSLARAGEIRVEARECLVLCGDGILALERVQPANGRVVSAKDWIHGARPVSGELLGT